jgi:hypothetical protein
MALYGMALPRGKFGNRAIFPRITILCNLSFDIAVPTFPTAHHPKPPQNRVSQVKLIYAPANSCFAAILLKTMECAATSGRWGITGGRKFQTKLYFSIDYEGTVGYFDRIRLILLVNGPTIHTNMVFIRGRFY